MPPGHLLIRRNHSNFFKWFHSTSNSSILIPKKDEHTAALLARKQELIILQKSLLSERKSILSFLNRPSDALLMRESRLLDCPEYHRLLSTIHSNEKFISDWVNQPYDKSKNHPEHLIFHSVNDHFCRSKSEVFIETALYQHGIPYRYECRLENCPIAIYPDFTILHPTKLSLFYWEHNGKMEDPNYVKKHTFNVEQFCNMGIYPGVNLIQTYETKDHPLDPAEVERLIQWYFK